MKFYYLLLCLPLLLTLGCGNDEDLDCSQDLPTLEEAIAAANTNNLPVQTFTRDGRPDLTFQYIIVEPGGDVKPNVNSTVTVNYRGTFTDLETVFDETPEDGSAPRRIPLNRTIAGWQLGIPQIGIGGRIILFLPASVAFGTQGAPGSICPDQPIVFDVELLDFDAATNCAAEFPTLADVISQFDSTGMGVDTFTVPTITGEFTSFFYIIQDPGNQEIPDLNSTVRVNYRGALTDNQTVFDRTPADGSAPRDLPLAGLISGWQFGLPLIGNGGRIVLFLPSEFAFGEQGSAPSICPNQDVIFEIELISFTN